MIPAGILNGELGLAALIAITSGFIRGFSGFGSALINAPLMALLFGPIAAVPMSATFEFAAPCANSCLLFRRRRRPLLTQNGSATGVSRLPLSGV